MQERDHCQRGSAPATLMKPSPCAALPSPHPHPLSTAPARWHRAATSCSPQPTPPPPQHQEGWYESRPAQRNPWFATFPLQTRTVSSRGLRPRRGAGRSPPGASQVRPHIAQITQAWLIPPEPTSCLLICQLLCILHRWCAQLAYVSHQPWPCRLPAMEFWQRQSWGCTSPSSCWDSSPGRQ